MSLVVHNHATATSAAGHIRGCQGILAEGMHRLPVEVGVEGRELVVVGSTELEPEHQVAGDMVR